MTPVEKVSILNNIATGLAALAGATVAILGFKTWKKQIAWKTNYELARRLLKATYQVRDAIKFVRNPFISLGEMSRALKEEGIGPENSEAERDQTNRAVYSTRWKKIIESLTNFDSELLEAQVLWGVGIIEVQKPLRQCAAKLNIHITQVFEPKEMRAASQTEIQEVIYDAGVDPKNKFTNEIAEAVQKLEEFLKPYLKL